MNVKKDENWEGTKRSEMMRDSSKNEQGVKIVKLSVEDTGEIR